jgi:hypothetical protein
MTTVVSIWLAAFLALAAALKAWRSEQTGSALATYGLTGPIAQRGAVWALVSVELALAGALVAGAGWASLAAAGLFVVFTASTSAALLAGREGRLCACFGSASRLSSSSPVRAAALALLAAALAAGWLPTGPSGYDRWLTLALSATLAAVVAIALAVFALAREVGVLRLAASGRGALEIPEEGPQVGSLQPWAETLHAGTRATLRLAIFTSEGCPLCHQLAPAVAHVAADPLLAVRVFDEVADSAVWAEAAIPGSPFAVVLSLEGVALAKGTYNSLAQLESVVSTGRFRERGLSVAA